MSRKTTAWFQYTRFRLPPILFSQLWFFFAKAWSLKKMQSLWPKKVGSLAELLRLNFKIGSQYRVNLTQIFSNYSDSTQWLNFLGQNDSIFSFSDASKQYSYGIFCNVEGTSSAFHIATFKGKDVCLGSTKCPFIYIYIYIYIYIKDYYITGRANPIFCLVGLR